MAKSSKKSARKAVRKASKKAPKKTVKKAAKKQARKQKRKVSKSTWKKFLVIYHAPSEAMVQTANVSPEQLAKGMEMWKTWAARVGSKLADLAAPLINGRRLSASGSSAPSIKEVSGYSVLQAEDLEQAIALLEGHPHISGWHPQATIEIHETMLLPGM